MRKYLSGGMLLAAGLLLATPGLGATQDEDAAAATATQASVPELPAGAKKLKNPVESTAESIENGRMLFSSQCVMCHGVAGDGKGGLAVRLEMEVPDFTNAARQKQRVDGELFWILTYGHGRMPGEGDRLDDTTKWHIVNYIRSLDDE